MPVLEVGEKGAGSCPDLPRPGHVPGFPQAPSPSFLGMAVDTEPRANAVQHHAASQAQS